MADIDKCNCDAIEVLEPEPCNTVKVTITTTEPNQNVCIGLVRSDGWKCGLQYGFSDINIDGISLNLSEYEGSDSPHWNQDAIAYTFTLTTVGIHELLYTLLDSEIKNSSFCELGYAIDDDNNWETLDTTVEIGSCVTSIGYNAFNDCASLTSIIISNGVTSIGYGAYWDCTKLTSITYDGTKTQWSAITKGSYWKYNVPTTCVIQCTDGNISISEVE